MREQTILSEDGDELVLALDGDPAAVAKFVSAMSAQLKEDHLHAGNNDRLQAVIELTKTALHADYFKPEIVRLSKKKPVRRSTKEADA